MAGTYTPIATYTVPSVQASYTFSSLGSYTDIILIASAKSTAYLDLLLQFNGDTTSGLYSYTDLTGDGTSATSHRSTAKNFIALDNNGAVQSANHHICIAHIMNYSNSTTFKTVIARSSNGGAPGGADLITGLWRNTNAITSITLSLFTSANFAVGSTFTLYGILAA